MTSSGEPVQDAPVSSRREINDPQWQLLEGINAATTKFPARARVQDESIVVFATGTGFRGVQRSCPHLKASLMTAQLMSNCAHLRCTEHSFIFRLSDGKGVNCPGFRIKVYEIREEAGALFVKLPT
jgi:nitrite reductase/ring-hydroxylating ferredoxin subunit